MSEAECSPVAGWLEGRPEAPAAVHADGAVTTRAELARRVSAAAAALADMPAGSRIAVDADAPHNFAVLLSAVLWRDCVPVLFAGRGAMHETLADEYDAVLTTESHRSFPKPALVADFAENPCPASELRAPEAERPLVLFTSGSSGTPKRIEKTVGLMSREAVITQRLFGRHLEGAVIAATVDPRHLYGLTFAVWMAMTTGTPVADARTVYQEQLLEFDRPVALVTTPTFSSILLDDRLEMSSDKVFRLLGRRDRIVKIGEIRLSLIEIERVVKEALGLEIRALSVKQAGRTVIGAVVCERTSPGWRGRCPNRIETTAALAGRLDPLARPRLWRHVADWPTDAQGKVVVPMLAELFEHKETTHG